MRRTYVWLSSACALLSLFVSTFFFLPAFRSHADGNQSSLHATFVQCSGWIMQDESSQSASAPWYPQGSSPGANNQYSQFSQTGSNSYTGTTLPTPPNGGESILSSQVPQDCSHSVLLKAKKATPGQATMAAWDPSVLYSDAFRNSPQKWQVQGCNISVQLPKSLNALLAKVRYDFWSTNTSGGVSGGPTSQLFASSPLYTPPGSGSLHWLGWPGYDVDQNTANLVMTNGSTPANPQLSSDSMGNSWYQLGSLQLGTNTGLNGTQNMGDIPAGSIGLIVTLNDDDPNAGTTALAGAMKFDCTFTSTSNQPVQTSAQGTSPCVNGAFDKQNWMDQDIGGQSQPGSAKCNAAGSIVVSGSGLNMSSAKDISSQDISSQYNYAYHSAIQGPVTIVAHLTNMTRTTSVNASNTSGGEIGVMIRATPDAYSAYAMMVLSKSGAFFESYSGSVSSLPVKTPNTPDSNFKGTDQGNGQLFAFDYWLKLVRTQNQITGYVSKDGGKSWTQQGTPLTIGSNDPLSGKVLIGLAVNSDDGAALNNGNFGHGILDIAAFDNVSVTQS